MNRIDSHLHIAGNGKLNTFSGVFTPSILTILGIILFLRLGYVVGSTGLAHALLIILLANAISVLTSWSVAIIATNMRVKEGGDYYLISRTLGPAFGGAIGTIIFLAQSVSVGFYCIGFGEAVGALFGLQSTIAAQWIALLAVLGLFYLAWRGLDWATRFQYAVMALLFLALAFFASGALGEFKTTQLQANLLVTNPQLGFWMGFAIFFPAVTGFTQGVSMSGELQNPSRNIPRGLFMAVGLSSMVYFGVAILLAGAMPASDLGSDYRAFWKLSAWSPAIDAGVMAATLSSALASLMGAPRILHALARDRIFPLFNYFSVTSGESGNPRRALTFSGLIAIGVIYIGDLNLLAGIVTMFFLVSYGLLNFATWFEAQSGSPSFRPGIHFYHKSISLLGTLACAGAILALNPLTGAVAVAIIYVIYAYINLRHSPNRWADSWRSYHLQRVREHLISAAREFEHPKDWRPQCLILIDDTEAHERLLHFSNWISGGGGISQALRVVNTSEVTVNEHIAQQRKQLRSLIEAHDAAAFPLIVANSDSYATLWNACQSACIGPLQVNTVVAVWPPHVNRCLQEQSHKTMLQKLLSLSRLEKNIVLVNITHAHLAALKKSHRKTLDIWCDYSATDSMLLILAYIFTRSEEWSNSKIRLIAPCLAEHERIAIEAKLHQMCEEARINVEIVTVVTDTEHALMSVSQESQLIFIPFSIKNTELYHPLLKHEQAGLDKMPILVFGLSAQELDLDAEPEHGPQASAARLIDRIQHVIELQHKQQEQTDRCHEALHQCQQQLRKAIAEHVSHEELHQLYQALELAQKAFNDERSESIRYTTVLETLYERAEDMEIDPELLPRRLDVANTR